MEEGKGERYLASGRQYGNALLGVRHQEEEVHRALDVSALYHIECPGGKTLKDSETLSSLGLTKGGKLYFRDLGPQVRWTTVSFCHALF